MFITAKRHEREKQELLGASNRFTDAILKNSEQGLFLIDAKGKLQPHVSRSLQTLFRRQEFVSLSFEKLLGPVVTAKTLSGIRSQLAVLLGTTAREETQPRPASAPRAQGPPPPDFATNTAAPLELSVSPEPPAAAMPPTAVPAAPKPLGVIEVRLANPDGSFDAAHYSFEFDPIESEPRLWLVRVSDITLQVQTARELEDLRGQLQMHSEILRGVLQMGGARFAAFLQRTGASMKTINAVLKKPAREADAFRSKLEETLNEVDRVRRDAAAFKLTALEGAARLFEDSLHELKSRRALSGSDFLPLAVKLDQLYGQYASLKSLTASVAPAREIDPATAAPHMTEGGTQVIEAPKFAVVEKSAARSVPGARRSAPAGTLENTLRALTDHVAQEHAKTLTLECQGLHRVPTAYQSAIKNVAIQLIRNAVMHGIEPPAARVALGKQPQGTLRLEFKTSPEGSFELLFEDDGCGLDPDQVRATAIARGVITGEGAARLRDREAIKLIFKSGYTTLTPPGDQSHGSGMSLVRRYIHEAGGKIAIASLLGHETRFKVTLPPLPPEADPAHPAPAHPASGEQPAVADAKR